MTEIEKVAQAVLDEQFLAATDRACELQERVKDAAAGDPVHAELRRALEQFSDIERQVRARNQLQLAQRSRETRSHVA